MKKLATILTILISLNCFSQDSVRAKVIKTSEKVLVYQINGMRFISFDCGCGLKRGDTFMIERKKWDSLLRQAKRIRKKDIEN